MAIHDLTSSKDRHRSAHRGHPPQFISFNRNELNTILATYGRMVSAGEWTDYGVSNLSTSAVFSVFHGASTTPLYRIVKIPAHRSHPQTFRIVGIGGKTLRSGGDLGLVMQFFDKKLIRVISCRDRDLATSTR